MYLCSQHLERLSDSMPTDEPQPYHIRVASDGWRSWELGGELGSVLRLSRLTQMAPSRDSGMMDCIITLAHMYI